MKIKWVDWILILFGLFIIYQLMGKIFGGSWQTEGLIISLLIFNIGVVWRLSMNIVKLNMKFEGHMRWHKKGNQNNF